MAQVLLPTQRPIKHEVPEEDWLDKLLKGVQVAQGITGVAVNVAKIQEAREARETQKWTLYNEKEKKMLSELGVVDPATKLKILGMSEPAKKDEPGAVPFGDYNRKNNTVYRWYVKPAPQDKFGFEKLLLMQMATQGKIAADNTDQRLKATELENKISQAASDLEIKRARLDLDKMKAEREAKGPALTYKGLLGEKEAKRELELGKRLPPQFQQQYGGAKEASDALDVLERRVKEAPDSFFQGGLVYALQYSPFATETKASDSIALSTKQAVGRFMEGGVLRKEDEYKYDRMVGTVTETPELLQRKIANTRELMIIKNENQINFLKQQGYDSSGLEIPDSVYKRAGMKRGQYSTEEQNEILRKAGYAPAGENAPRGLTPQKPGGLVPPAQAPAFRPAAPTAPAKSKISAEDKAAMDWLKANPEGPSSDSVRAKLIGKGLL